jgi:hypothetical protein
LSWTWPAPEEPLAVPEPRAEATDASSPGVSAGHVARWARRLHMTRHAAQNEPHAHREALDPLLVEEQVIDQLYGVRTGTVSSWTVKPPVRLG